MGKRVLITGGAGFIGSHLVDALADHGHQVRVLDSLEPQVHGALREQGRWPNYCRSDVEYILGDVRNADVFVRALHDVDVVYHFAAAVGVGQSMYEIQKYVDINVGGTAVLLDILANNQTIRERVSRIIVASSMSNYGEGEYVCPEHGRVYPQPRTLEQLHNHEWELVCPISSCNKQLKPVPTRESKPMHATSVYAIAKKTQEELCLAIGEAYQIPAVALRFFNAYGSRQALSNPYTGVAAIFASRLLNGNPPTIFEDGQQMREFVHVSDVVQACILAMDKQFAPGSYNVGSGSPTSILNIAENLIDRLEVDTEPIILNQFRAGDIRHCYADITKLQAQGYKPRKSLKEGMAELINWIQDQQAVDSFEAAAMTLQKRGLTI